MEEKKRDQLELLDQELEFKPFDEMNLVEVPFCLLDKKPQKRRKLALSPDGNEYLQTAGETLPTALASHVVLGLMWLTMKKNNFSDPVVRFELRELIEDYMYPRRFGQYRANGKTLASVERELHRVAETRIRSKRWYDKANDRHVEMDAAIIDYIQLEQPGGRNSPRILEVRWGMKTFESVRARYTREFDLEMFLKLPNPLDKRLWRWLSRQLQPKARQHVSNVVTFARYKLLLTGQKIDRGGRTASSYAVKKITESLERMNGLGFGVRMTVDRNKKEFGLLFERISSQRNEVVDTDPAADLVLHFREVAHGAVRSKRIAQKDREEAARWLEEYGTAQGRWMISSCVDMQRKRGADPILTFRGLLLYEAAAAGAFERHEAEKGGQLALEVEGQERRQEAAYLRYCGEVVEAFEAELDEEEREALMKLAAERAAPQVAESHGFGHSALVRAQFQALLSEKVELMSREDFDAAAPGVDTLGDAGVPTDREVENANG